MGVSITSGTMVRKNATCMGWKSWLKWRAITCPSDTTPANTAINSIPRVFAGKLDQSVTLVVALFRSPRGGAFMIQIIGQLVHKTSVALARPFHGPHNPGSIDALCD